MAIAGSKSLYSLQAQLVSKSDDKNLIAIPRAYFIAGLAFELESKNSAINLSHSLFGFSNTVLSRSFI